MKFVTSDDDSVRGFGIGKLVDPKHNPGLVQYFVSPADAPVERVVDPGSVAEYELHPQERIFFVEQDLWQVGRLQSYLGAAVLGIRLPNEQLRQVRTQDAYVRSSLPITTPLGLLQTRNTETPFWHEGRAALVRSLAGQRGVYRGLTGLASANVEILPHQLTIARRVLNDPIPRYLLADEVGLGKTIEACVIVRQHLLDDPDTSSVLIVVPQHLVTQWRRELVTRFHIGDHHPVRIVAHDDEKALSAHRDAITLLVVDEAHDLAQHAYHQGREGTTYRAVTSLAQKSKGVLLLSATPVVHNEDAFLAMLHLLDPAAHPLSDREGFQARIAHRDAIASAVRDLQADASAFFLEPALEALRPLATANPHLASRIDAVAALVDQSDDPARPGAIEALREYLHDSYRLDRRLLRTRRGQSSVRDALPKRGSEPWPLEDQGRNETFEWLDQWRFNCADVPERDACSTIFLEFLEAALRHPTLLATRVGLRKAALAKGAAPFFADELAFLGRIPAPLGVEHDPRIDALIGLLRIARTKKLRWVIFVSDSQVADRVTTALTSTFKVLRVAGDEGAPNAVATFRQDKDVVALICDEKSEHGLNLQGAGAGAVHYDLPLSVNRIEQRIGRLDRIGGDRSIRSLVPVVATSKNHANYETAWAKCLAEATHVFDRSVASLQHALDAGRRHLRDSFISGGVEAIADLSTAWSSKEGPLSLDKELRRIEGQDLLDELDILESEHHTVYDEIEEYEYATEPTVAEQLSQELSDWATKSLRLERHDNSSDNGAVEYKYIRETLVPKDRFENTFKNSFHYARRRGGLCTEWMHHDRDQAMKLNLPLARVGHPFIEDLERFMEQDDRGRAYACWREVSDYQNEYGTGNPADLFFRFDFLVEANFRAVAPLITEGGLATGAVTRRAADALPPRFSTIWVDVDGLRVSDTDLIEELERPYDRDTDTNLRGARWRQVDDLGMVADWSRMCESAWVAALQFLKQGTRLEERVREAQRRLESSFKAATRQLEARIAVSTRSASERDALAIERRLYECLKVAVAEPRLRLDSVGAVFLSGQALPQSQDG